MKTEFNDSEIRQWGERHDLRISSMTDLRCAFEDAASMSKPAAPALVPLDARRIAKLAFEMCSACYSGMDHQFAGMTIVKFAQAVQADFCRINGLTVGDGGV